MRARIGQHDAGGLRAEHGLQRFDIDVAVGIGRDLAHGATAHHRRRRIGAVRRVGHDDFVALQVAARFVVRHDHGHAGELALRAGHRRQRHAALHAGDVGQDFLQVVHAGQVALAQRLGGIGVAAGETVHQGDRVAGARVVLHGARTERIEIRVDREVLAAQLRVVTHGLQLGDFRQADLGVAQESFGQRRSGNGVGQLRGGHAAGLGLLENQHGMGSGCRNDWLFCHRPGPPKANRAGAVQEIHAPTRPRERSPCRGCRRDGSSRGTCRAC